MNKKNIEDFAVNSRRQLIENLTYEANKIGITKETIQNPDNIAEDMQTFTTSGVTNTIYGKQIEQRQQLIKEIENNGFDQTIEKIAYTWFNRIIAIRFMEINNYLPTKTRVLSSINPEKKEPDIITEALNIDLDYTNEDKKTIYQLKEENNTDELFKLLFIKQCNKLNEILPELFETIDDYTELLFNIQLSNQNNIINKLTTTIPEEDFKNQVEIIGWLYQYYNKELKDETYKNIKKQKVGKDRIPAVTQLFTPDWIVKYMVENSLGRLWLENHPNTELQNKWKYYLEEAQQTPEVEKQLEQIKATYKNTKLEEIKILDPSMGSGHILVYVFDVLMQLYTSEGYTEKEAVISILQNNIYGIDIDDRAYQLSYFAIMMKARSYHKRVLNKKLKPNLIAIQETSKITEEVLHKIDSKDTLQLIEIFKNGKTLGSITKIKTDIKVKDIEKTVDKLIKKQTRDIILLSHENELNILKQIIKQTKILIKKYDIVITNPPYMGNSNMDKTLKTYLKNHYPNTKQDLFSVFMEKCLTFTKVNGFNALITMQSWMFLATYENLRKEFIKNQIINLTHLGPNAFDEIKGEIVQTSAYIIRKAEYSNYISTFVRLVDYNSELDKKNNFLNSDNYYKVNINSLKHIPKIPLSYWINNNFIKIFKNSENLSEIADVKVGLQTGDNNKYLRLWWEVNKSKIEFDNESCEESEKNIKKWYPHNKGGHYRKWYGNQDYIINWENNGNEIRKFKKSVVRNSNYYFNPSISWSAVSTNNSAFRYFPNGFIFDSNGLSLFLYENNYIYYILGFLNSKISEKLLSILAPTIKFEVGQVSLIPILVNKKYFETINKIVVDNIEITKNDWDENETSWNFNLHPLIKEKVSLKENFNKYVKYKETQFQRLKNNEIKLNKIFSEIYHENSIDINVEDQYISVRKAEYTTDVKSFISYVVGCIFGRYSLYSNGLIYSGGKFDINTYSKYIPDEDNIIPILDEEYFDDDIMNRFVEFIEVVYGKESLNENLDFIANALNKKGKSSKEVIRSYFINDFFEEHKKMYSVTMRKAPIYWMFDSGKQNAFKCLIYMHRYEPDLLSRIRFDYLHKTQRAIEENIKRQDNIINNSENKTHIKKANKEKTKLVKQLDEIKLYDQALAHVANQRIELDLDDGVKVNYAKFQNIEVVDPKTNKTKKINLLSKL